jgi:hypothetical protein
MCKAFDTVPRNMLWYKLIKTGIHGKFLSALQSLYENVKCAVKGNDCLTPWLKVDTGVKQGCLLSHILFAHQSRVLNTYKNLCSPGCESHSRIDVVIDVRMRS